MNRYIMGVRRLPFNELKATQAAARFLQLRGGKMYYLKLIKLLYFLDREALIRSGRPITTDRYISMDDGPVVSRIYDMIVAEPQPGISSTWREFISPPEQFQIRLLKEAGSGELSRAEEKLISEIFERLGHKSRWELVRLSHDLPEWQDPACTSIPLEYIDIFRAAGKTELEIAALDEELENLALAQLL